MNANLLPPILIGGYVALSIFAVVFGMIYVKLSSSKKSGREEAAVLAEIQTKLRSLEDNWRIFKQEDYGKKENIQAIKVGMEAEIRQNTREIAALKEKLDRMVFESLMPKKEEKVTAAPPKEEKITLKEMAVEAAEAAVTAENHPPKPEEAKKEEKPAEQPPVDDVVALLQKKAQNTAAQPPPK